ncbi:MAG TPA: LLM class flavin-dependent oxidoreductase [Pseudonocardiaceae bacterium]|nr:LLM class flavin-dependent oxidoreductase [Pseudonocardiaceae bacterium]
MTSLGMVIRPHVPPEQLTAIARVADDAGLEQLWLWEDSFFAGSIAQSAAVLAATERVRVGVGVIPVPFRNVGLLAMEIAALDRMFPGRFITGVGHGSQGWMGQAGARVPSPMTLLREYVDALRALLRGEKLTVEGTYVNLTDVQLTWPPATPLPVLLGATGPRTVRLAGEIGDGTVLDAQYTAEGVRKQRALIEEGHATAGRTDPHELVVFVTAVTGPDAQERYRAEMAEWSHDPAAGIGVAGDAGEIANALNAIVDAGADTVIVVPVGSEPDLPGFARFIAQDVRPLVR